MLDLARIFFGTLFTFASAYAIGRVILPTLPLPREVRLAIGSACLSMAVFALMAMQMASPMAFGAVAAAALGASALVRRVACESVPRCEDRSLRICALVIFAVYGVFYGVHALAPEIQPDAVTYHLGLVAEAMRDGGFSERVGFYEVIPQGAEMLFAFAFAFGKHSAAKLVHLGFLIASVPLMLSLGRRLGLGGGVSLYAAILYFCAPVVGISGTSAYNDAMLVFFVLAATDALLAWKQTGDSRYLWPAGIAAGFCYAVKMPGALVCVLAVLFTVSVRPKWRPVAIVAAGCAAFSLPWLWHAWWLTGNPIAPLANRYFPNPYFSALIYERLSAWWQHYEVLSPFSYVKELTISGRALQGHFGPVLLLAPLGLLALRKPAGRFLWLAALALGAPWYFNVGARFLMPAAPFVMLALAASLPRVAWPAVLAVHALCGLPPVMRLYSDRDAWCLRGLPWKAALRIEPESEYLKNLNFTFHAAWMVDQYVKPGEVVLDLHGLPSAYSRYVALNNWQHPLGETLTDGLRIAGMQNAAIIDLDSEWSETPLSALRFRLGATGDQAWKILEAELRGGGSTVRISRDCLLSADSNPWGVVRLFDRDLTTAWTSFEAARPGMYIEVCFPKPVAISAARLTCVYTGLEPKVEVEGESVDGIWRTLSNKPLMGRRAAQELRLNATRRIKRAGIRWIMAPSDQSGLGALGRLMTTDPDAWGLVEQDVMGDYHLLKIK